MLGLSQNKAIAEVVADKLVNGLSVIGGIINVFNVILPAECVVLVKLENVAVYVAKTGLVHFGDRILRQVSLILLGIVDISRKFAAVIGLLRYAVQPVGLDLTVGKSSEVAVAAHVAVIVESHAL